MNISKEEKEKFFKDLINGFASICNGVIGKLIDPEITGQSTQKEVILDPEEEVKKFKKLYHEACEDKFSYGTDLAEAQIRIENLEAEKLNSSFFPINFADMSKKCSELNEKYHTEQEYAWKLRHKLSVLVNQLDFESMEGLSKDIKEFLEENMSPVWRKAKKHHDEKVISSVSNEEEFYKMLKERADLDDVPDSNASWVDCYECGFFAVSDQCGLDDQGRLLCPKCRSNNTRVLNFE